MRPRRMQFQMDAVCISLDWYTRISGLRLRIPRGAIEDLIDASPGAVCIMLQLLRLSSRVVQVLLRGSERLPRSQGFSMPL